MNVSKNVLRGLVDLCEELYREGSDNCTLTIGVPNTDMELEVEVSYRFNKNVEFYQNAED